MKKFLLVTGFICCLMTFSVSSVSADMMNRNGNTPGEELKHDINRGIQDTNRALGTDFDRIDGNNRIRTNANMNRNGNTPGEELKHDINRGINNTNRALGTDFDRIDGNNRAKTNATMNANNYRTNAYRTNAATDNDGFDWGWLGLLGLIGLAGMRSRVGDRDRA